MPRHVLEVFLLTLFFEWYFCLNSYKKKKKKKLNEGSDLGIDGLLELKTPNLPILWLVLSEEMIIFFLFMLLHCIGELDGIVQNED